MHFFISGASLSPASLYLLPELSLTFFQCELLQNVPSMWSSDQGLLLLIRLFLFKFYIFLRIRLKSQIQSLVFPTFVTSNPTEIKTLFFSSFSNLLCFLCVFLVRFSCAFLLAQTHNPANRAPAQQ